MNHKTKAKIEQTIFMVLSFCGFAAVGGCIGYFLGYIEKNSGGRLAGKELIIALVVSLLVIAVAYYINLCLHEVGHMIFGLLSGYRFNSLRFGKLMLVKREGKLHFARYNLPGTGGQCIMSAPEGDAEHMPVVLYNMGGLFVNLAVVLTGTVLFLVLKDTVPYAGMVFFTLAFTALIILITNGIPLSQIGNDGANTIILYKNKQAREAFRNQLEVINYLANDCGIHEIPAEYLAFDRSVPMNDPLITSQAVNHYNYLIAAKRFAEAKELAQFILDNAGSINQIHEKILYGELVFLTAVVDRNAEEAKKIYAAHAKELKAVAGYISVQRVLYAYYTLVEPDEKKAADFAKRFANTVKHYPYPKDAAGEQEQFDMVAEAVKAKTTEEN